MRKELSGREGAVGLRGGSPSSCGAGARDGFPEEEAEPSGGQVLSFLGLVAALCSLRRWRRGGWGFFGIWGHGEMRFSKPA